MLVKLRMKWIAKRGIVEMCRDAWRFEKEKEQIWIYVTNEFNN